MTLQPTGTVTLVLTDIEGSTKLLDSIGTEAYREALTQHRAIVRAAFAQYRGYEVDCTGDAFFFAFASAADAVHAVARAFADLRGGPIAIRAGVHTGEPTADSGGYVGIDVHRTARIMSAAHGGQALLSAVVRSLIREEVTELGEHRLKDIAEPVALWQLGRAVFPPLRTLSFSNLPTPASSLLGRQSNLGEAARLLGANRLLTVVGAGGIGKTRFAIELAARQLADFPSGAFWVSLAPLRDPALLLDSVRAVLGAKTDLSRHIGDRRMLIVFDNFEQVTGAAPEVSHLLSTCANLKVLVTSREILRVEGERVYSLGPLHEQASVALFCERAQVDPDAAVHTLCRLLDHLPLGIELAAARARLLTPAQLVARIGQRLDLFKGGRDASPRQTSLRAAIAWSHDLLNVTESTLFARLSVFEGGCTIEAAEAVADACLDTLQSLVDKSLVQQASGRFSMYQSVRQFAAEQRLMLGQEQTLHGRLFDYFLTLVESVPFGAWPRGWGEQLRADHHNLRNALAGAPSPEQRLRLACGLGPFWLRQGDGREGRMCLEQALSRAPGASLDLLASAALLLGQMSVATEQHGRSAQLLTSALSQFRAAGDLGGQARAQLALGWLAFLHRDLEQAVDLHERSVALARAANAPAIVAQALGRLAAVAERCGDFLRVASLEQESLALMREIGDDEGVATSIAGMAWRAVRRRDYQAARTLAEQSATLTTRAGLELSAATHHTLLIALLGLGLHQDVARQIPAALGRAVLAGGMLSLAAMLEIAGGLAARSGAAVKAALLTGAAAGLVNRSGVTNDELVEAREVYSAWLATARGHLGDAQWDKYHSVGTEMRSDEAVALALDGAA